MSLEDLGNLGEFLAAVGVLVTLVYLAIQIGGKLSARSISRPEGVTVNRFAVITATAFLITGCGSETSVETSSSPAERTVFDSSRSPRSIQIHKRFFENRSEVLEDLKASGFWPTTVVSGPSPGVEMHWHSEEVHGYVVEGETFFLDGKSGARHVVGPGDKIIVPARALHAEGEIDERVIYIIAVPEAMLSEAFLKRRPPEDLQSVP